MLNLLVHQVTSRLSNVNLLFYQDVYYNICHVFSMNATQRHSAKLNPFYDKVQTLSISYIMWVLGRRRLDGPCKRPGVTDPPLSTPVITGGCKMLTGPCCHMFVYQTPTVVESTGLCHLIYIRF